MSVTSVQRFYRMHARVYDSTRWMILHGRRRAVDLLQLRLSDQVLEIGCGTGLNFGLIVRRLDPQHGRLTGLDFSSDMLERARRRVDRRKWRNVSLVYDDATQFDLATRFDAILFGYSLTMIPNWGAAIERAHAHLKPGGRLVVLDFGRFDSWGPLAPLMRAWLRANHVETCSAYVDKLQRTFGNVDVGRWLGGYSFTALVRKLG